MSSQTGNLSPTERGLSAAAGLVLTGLALGGGRSVYRTVAGLAGATLLARAAAGHCGVKAAAAGHSSLFQGLADQWRCLVKKSQAGRTLPGSPAHAQQSRAVDQSVEESFPASDPPGSRLPDDPPANAGAKWAKDRGPA